MSALSSVPFRPLFFLGVSAGFAIACGGSAAVSPGGGGTGGTVGSTHTGTPSSTSTGANGSTLTAMSGMTTHTSTVQCFTDAGALIPAAKACQADSDCTMLATEGCCGPSVILGIASQELSIYSACYPPPTNCPPAGCASEATTEDGELAPLGILGAEVSCDSVKGCTTRVQPPDAGPADSGADAASSAGDGGQGTLCASDSVCGTGLKCCYPCGTAGCHNECIPPMANGNCPLYP